MKHLLFLFFIIFLACDSNLPNQIKDPELRDVLTKIIDRAGGIEAYNSLDSLSFVKRTVLYHSVDSLENDYTQQIKFIFKPQLSGSITWSDSIDVYRINYANNRSTKSVNGIDSGEKEEGLRQTVMSSYFTLFIPFKLLDPGVKLKYLGKEEFSARNVHVIKADFDPSKHDNHSTSDSWWIYFDSETYEMLGYLVYHAPTYALVVNRSKADQSPINFDSKRETYRVDSLKNKQFLRAEFEYTQFKVYY